jgi:hypothetical protein
MSFVFAPCAEYDKHCITFDQYRDKISLEATTIGQAVRQRQNVVDHDAITGDKPSYR